MVDARRGAGRFHFIPELSPELLAGFLLGAALLFNFALAFVNANGVTLTRGHVIVAEVLIVGAALALCLRFWSAAMIPWAALIWFMLTSFVLLSLLRGFTDPKHIRDVLIMPIFIMLGIVYARGDLVRLVCKLQFVVLVFMIFEAVDPVKFGQVFNVTSYYVNTRDFKAEAFWNPDANLFLSSLRPGERFLFASSGIHRLSSIFLEPVSLGNWCIIVTLFIAAFWQSMSWRALGFLVISNFLVLVGCDGRLATVTCVLILVGAPFFRRVPAIWAAAHLPIVVGIAFLLVDGFGMNTRGDTFAGRIVYSIDVMHSLGIGGLFGVDLSKILRSADSGIAYFILTQSLIGVAVIWMAICVVMPASSSRGSVVVHGICLYLALNLMVSFSLFSIKTASLLWFMYGYTQAIAVLQAKRTPSSRVAPWSSAPGAAWAARQ